ncbi:hypothetical protein Fot_08010 [Forsythia ovata]|uniref:Uncharacterized protein n=1 Tax=Forsythia ovata TaxID=205694 RepID=A0ABD1WXR6_9LAMI
MALSRLKATRLLLHLQPSLSKKDRTDKNDLLHPQATKMIGYWGFPTDRSNGQARRIERKGLSSGRRVTTGEVGTPYGPSSKERSACLLERAQSSSSFLEGDAFYSLRFSKQLSGFRSLVYCLSMSCPTSLYLVIELVDRDLYCRNRPLLGKFGSFGERGTNANGLGYGSEYCLA